MSGSSRNLSRLASRVATTQIDLRIIRLAIKGLSIREIAARVGLGKSRVQQRMAAMGFSRKDWDAIRSRPAPIRRQDQCP